MLLFSIFLVLLLVCVVYHIRVFDAMGSDELVSLICMMCAHDCVCFVMLCLMSILIDIGEY